jgi:hypothetical protein
LRPSLRLKLLFHEQRVEDAMARHGKPEIFNTDQGSQFTGQAFTGVLTENAIAISMDGKGTWRDNVCSSSGPGAASNTRRSICAPTTTSARLALQSVAIWTSITQDDRTQP